MPIFWEVSLLDLSENEMPLKSSMTPILMQADNFTPLARTPWAGHDIHRRYKKHHSSVTRIGESWEVSCDPDFPSRCISDRPDWSGKTLQEVITADPETMISPGLAEVWKATGILTCPILVKLIQAASPLSVQIHPDDSDPDLKERECGKPESWLILNAEPGAGIYLGLKHAMSRADLKERLEAGKFSGNDLTFVPVHDNDYFELEPGVLHSIGPNVTILEPQRIVAGKSGKTFRLWDWNRKYSSDGHEDPVTGKARELHIEQGIKLFDPETQYGSAFAETFRRQPTRNHEIPGVNHLTWPANRNYQVHRIGMSADNVVRITCEKGEGFGTITVLDGILVANGMPIAKGQSAFLPWTALPLTAATALGTDFVLVNHAGMTLKLQQN